MKTDQQKIQSIADILYSHVKQMMGMAYISQNDISDIAKEIQSLQSRPEVIQPVEPQEERELHFFDNEKGDVSIEVNGEMVGYIKTKFPAEFFNAFTIEVIPQEPKRDNTSQVEKQTAEEIKNFICEFCLNHYGHIHTWKALERTHTTFNLNEAIELLKEYASNQQPKISVTDVEKANRYYFDCWGRTGSSMTKTILAVNKEDAILLFKGKYPDSAFDPPYTDE